MNIVTVLEGLKEGRFLVSEAWGKAYIYMVDGGNFLMAEIDLDFKPEFKNLKWVSKFGFASINRFPENLKVLSEFQLRAAYCEVEMVSIPKHELDALKKRLGELV